MTKVWLRFAEMNKNCIALSVFWNFWFFWVFCLGEFLLLSFGQCDECPVVSSSFPRVTVIVGCQAWPTFTVPRRALRRLQKSSLRFARCSVFMMFDVIIPGLLRVGLFLLTGMAGWVCLV